MTLHDMAWHWPMTMTEILMIFRLIWMICWSGWWVLACMVIYERISIWWWLWCWQWWYLDAWCYICHICCIWRCWLWYGDDDDGYWVTDAWNGVVWFVDHPVKLLSTEDMRSMRKVMNFFKIDRRKIWGQWIKWCWWLFGKSPRKAIVYWIYQIAILIVGMILPVFTSEKDNLL